MATRFCCSAPSRSTSPQDEPARPLRNWKSFATIRQTPVNGSQCLIHDNPPQLPAPKTSDDLELHRIFVAASLPEDHPDALWLPDRKPSLDDSIIRSPSFTNKLRRQLSRKSLASGKNGTKSIRLGRKLARSQSQIFGAAASVQEQEPLNLFSEEGQGLGFDPDALSLVLSDSRFASLKIDGIARGFDQPEHSQDTNNVESQVGCYDSRRTTSQRSTHSTRRSVSLPRSLRTMDTPAPVRRARSSSSFGEGVSSQWRLDSDMVQFDGSWHFSLGEALHPIPSEEARPLSTVQESPSPHVGLDSNSHHKPSQDELLSVCKADISLRNDLKSVNPNRPISQVSEVSLHLHNMRISEHLRSPSQQSEASSFDDPIKPWNRRPIGHASLNSVIWSSSGSQRLRGMASTDCETSDPSPKRTRSAADASSSIYSRSPSSDVPLPYDILQTTHGPQSHAQMTPLSPSENLQNFPSLHRSTSGDLSRKKHNTPPDDGSKISDAPEIGPIDDKVSSLTKSDSTVSLGRLSKFKEDIAGSPATKSSKKRRSVLQILFPKFVKPKLRSVSTPVLWERTGLATAIFDGPSDDPGRLEVPETSAESQKLARSSSLNVPKLLPSSSFLSGNLSLSPATGFTTTSLANYELTLSASGDDRRRKSAIDLDMLKTAQQDNRKESGGQPLRRAAPLFVKGTEGSLMEKALHQHHLEKAALFRSSNNRSSMTTSSAHTPVFSLPFRTSATSTPRRMPSTVDELDPLEVADRPEGRRSQSMQQLRPPGRLVADLPMHSRKQSIANADLNQSMIGQRGRCKSAMPLAAWSRYPSHTRESRCGSASREDNIIIQDFAYNNGQEGDLNSDMDYLGTPSTGKGSAKITARKGRGWMVKSRSMTFGSVMRYYSNLFTSSAARNRRSSVAMGGHLEHPELEVLPPIFPSHPFGSARHRHASGSSHLGDLMEHLKEEMKEEGHHLKDEIVGEGHHLKDEIREEGHHLKDEIKQEGQFLRMETHDIFSHHSHTRKQESEESLDPLDPLSSEDVELERDSEDEDAPISPRTRTGYADDFSRPLDGANDGGCNEELNQPCRKLSARRLSRMYQAYVQFPTSMDAAEEAAQQDTGSLDSVLDSVEDSSLLTTPGKNFRNASDGTAVRRFPSVTVVDDRKGHWRSISLISAQSGKSLRNSTNDLLNLIVKAKNVEKDKLLTAGDGVL